MSEELENIKDDKSRVIVFLDDEKEPLLTYRPPVRFELDTSALDDGHHKLRIEAYDSNGRKGVRTIPFEVRNGPGIGINGLQADDILEGKVPILINSYGGETEQYWQPNRAETPAPIPTWAWVLLLVVVAWATFYIARQWNPPPEYANTPTYGKITKQANMAAAGKESGESISGGNALGANLFRTSCASCHQTNGQGLTGVFPPLAGDPVVTGQDPTQHIKIVLHGLQGKTINGVKYTAQMPAWADQLSDKEISAIINHERTSWGNNAPTTTPEQVAKIRKQLANSD
ncbi:MAG TPA: cytochrome c [Balneolales bacterium]|nr:cytochrome c [Balneolales bacterium]